MAERALYREIRERLGKAGVTELLSRAHDRSGRSDPFDCECTFNEIVAITVAHCIKERSRKKLTGRGLRRQQCEDVAQRARDFRDFLNSLPPETQAGLALAVSELSSALTEVLPPSGPSHRAQSEHVRRYHSFVVELGVIEAAAQREADRRRGRGHRLRTHRADFICELANLFQRRTGLNAWEERAQNNGAFRQLVTQVYPAIGLKDRGGATVDDDIRDALAPPS